MQSALHITTKVLPGNKIEINAPELAEGTDVEVFLVVPEPPIPPRRSVLEIIDSLKGHRLFETPEEADSYLQKERDSWES